MSSIRLLSARAFALLLASIPCIAAAAEPDSRLLSPAGEQALTPPPELATEDQLIPEGQPYAENHLGERIAVRSLDDPANPYYGQYGEWDRWLLAQWQPGEAPEGYFDQFKKYSYSAPPSGYSCLVSADGWLVPQLFADSFIRGRSAGFEETLLARATADWDDKYGKDKARPPMLSIYEPLPQDLYVALELAQQSWNGRELQIIPAWIGQAPPLSTVFIPNGEICCYGEMGLRFKLEEDQMPSMLPPGLTWYRYSSEGQLLGSLLSTDIRPDDDWIQFYFPDLETLAGNYGEGARVRRLGRYMTVTRPTAEAVEKFGRESWRGTKELLAAFDYNGSPVDPNAAPAGFSGFCNSTPYFMIEKNYAIQVYAGITGSTNESPYAGLADGPQLAQKPLLEMPWPLSITRGQGEDQIIRIPLPMDDPASPFVGQYTKWDRWQYQAINQISPDTQRRLDEQLAEANRKLAEAHRNGTQEPDVSSLFRGVPVDHSDDWRHAEMFFTPAGHMIPIADSAWRDFSTRRFLSWSSTSFTDTDWFGAHGSGELSDEDYAAFNNYRWQCAAARVPQIPDWLASQPVMKAVLLANGEVVAMGPLGSWSDSDEGSEELAGSSFEARWFRYSPQGELLGSAERGAEWAQFYCAGLSALSAEAAASDMQLYCIGEHIYLRPMNENTPRAFNWAGEEVSFSPALFGEMLFGEELSWRTLRNVLKVRRGESVAIPPLH